ncbi:MAG TPA: hypothetical protein VG900_03670 [Hyphomicrobiaceae bacterium]|jgi:hypothetical protein|nr:hypothetical protein [Hyphomicrobiaceae bacterium]
MNPGAVSTHAFALRRTVAPYVGFLVIMSGVMILLAYVSLKTRDWTPIASVQMAWPLFGVLVWIGTCYRIFWRDGAILQKASGGPDVSIRPDEITSVEQETSDVGTALAMRRPFRRIVIYAENPRGEGKYIDVSLKHFLADDVRKLMRAIHARRPDLALPKHWM